MFVRRLDGVRSPDDRSDIRGRSSTVPDIAALIRATNSVVIVRESGRSSIPGTVVI